MMCIIAFALFDYGVPQPSKYNMIFSRGFTLVLVDKVPSCSYSWFVFSNSLCSDHAQQYSEKYYVRVKLTKNLNSTWIKTAQKVVVEDRLEWYRLTYD